ncbi:MAG: type II toxin-antitoxin system Phd/YefM family antitoxin [Actinomycetota bacterium]
MEETLPLAEIKAHLSEVVDRVETHHSRITLTRKGKPAAVLISPDDLAALEETLDILSDPKAVADIRKARGEIARGKGISAEQLKRRYLRT